MKGSTRPSFAGWPKTFRRVPRGVLASATRQLAVMLAAHLPLLESLAAVAAECDHPTLREVLERVREDVRRGRSLADSLARHPAVFDALYVQLARAGEATGRLGELFGRLASHLERSEALRRRVRLALVYPAVVLAVALGAAGFLLTAVVPTFAALFADQGAVLPAPTRLVLRASDVLRSHGVLLGAAFAAVGAGVVRLARQPAVARRVDGAALRLPLAGPLLRRSLTAGTARTLGTLLSSGITLTEALALTAGSSGHAVLETDLRQALRLVRRGSDLHGALRGGRIFPDLAVRLVAAGEATGALDRMLLHAAEHYEAEVDAYVETLTALLEPALIVLVGGFLGGLLVALYLPLFELVTIVG